MNPLIKVPSVLLVFVLTCCGFANASTNSEPPDENTIDVPVLTNKDSEQYTASTSDSEPVPSDPTEPDTVAPAKEAPAAEPTGEKSWWQKVKESAGEAYDKTFSGDDSEEESTDEGEDVSGKPETPAEAGTVTAPESSTASSTSSVPDSPVTESYTSESESDEPEAEVYIEDETVFLSKESYEALVTHYNVVQNQLAQQNRLIENFCYPTAQ